MQVDTICGQLLDVANQEQESDGFRAQDLKTGAYTVRGPLMVGATLAGAGQETLATLAAYAAPLGVAFQLRDDVLGLIGDPRITGKDVGADIRAGKLTPPVRTALSSLPPGDRAVLERCLGNRHADTDQIATALRLIERCGAIERTERRIAELRDRALEAVTGTTACSATSASYLTALAHRMTARAA